MRSVLYTHIVRNDPCLEYLTVEWTKAGKGRITIPILQMRGLKHREIQSNIFCPTTRLCYLSDTDGRVPGKPHKSRLGEIPLLAGKTIPSQRTIWLCVFQFLSPGLSVCIVIHFSRKGSVLTFRGALSQGSYPLGLGCSSCYKGETFVQFSQVRESGWVRVRAEPPV